MRSFHFLPFFFFNDTATTEIYTLSLHDALPISMGQPVHVMVFAGSEQEGLDACAAALAELRRDERDRKSTRLNSSHGYISYAVFCLKKKKSRRSTDRDPIQCGLRIGRLARMHVR